MQSEVLNNDTKVRVMRKPKLDPYLVFRLQNAHNDRLLVVIHRSILVTTAACCWTKTCLRSLLCNSIDPFTLLLTTWSPLLRKYHVTLEQVQTHITSFRSRWEGCYHHQEEKKRWWRAKERRWRKRWKITKFPQALCHHREVAYLPCVLSSSSSSAVRCFAEKRKKKKNGWKAREWRENRSVLSPLFWFESSCMFYHPSSLNCSSPRFLLLQLLSPYFEGGRCVHSVAFTFYHLPFRAPRFRLKQQ